MNIKEEKKQWKDRRSRKLSRIKRKNCHRRSKAINKGNNCNKNIISQDCTLSTCIHTPPTIFSLFENTGETIDFFNKFLYDIRNKKYQARYFFNSENVTGVSVDSLIYLISLIKNIGISKKYSFSGNLPNNEEASNIYKESGFMAFF